MLRESVIPVFHKFIILVKWTGSFIGCNEGLKISISFLHSKEDLHSGHIGNLANQIDAHVLHIACNFCNKYTCQLIFITPF